MSANIFCMPRDAKIGIINRGEAAIRFIRAAKEYNAIHETNFSSVVFHTEDESDALFVREADYAVPFSSLSEFSGPAGSAYLNRKLIIKALKISGCSAAWAGWGFLSEDALFVKMLEDENFVFLGPSSKSMKLLGDKITAKTLAEGNGVPILKWSRGPVKSVNDARRSADEIGFPCIIKAANAGGGRGIRVVRQPEELASLFRSALDETRRITGGEVIFMEQMVEVVRHLEVQAVADGFGTILTFGVRDCSVQRRNQKIIEETPPPNLPGSVMQAMEKSAAALLKAADYKSAGTVEFLYDLKNGGFYFMEVNTRLQVEHPITEQMYGIDLVQYQIQIALGEKLDESQPIP
ncbi:MAG: biotin carboxylase N-terminal domain-containing protein, partial [Spirochaetota bacterium]